ncbi:MAG: sulfotransferase [Pseudomonadota bacterium]
MVFAPEEIVAAARNATRLEDFGGDSFREGLDVLCQSLDDEAQLNPLGETAVRAAMEGALINRLRVTDWITRHPEVLEERIEAPFIVVGLFRAGTTLMSYLLERDARHRPLHRWEASDSLPPPTPQTFEQDPRIEKTRAQMALVDQINPRLRVVQSEEPDGPTECIVVTGQDFKSGVWEAMANVPAYGQWLAQTDHKSAYDYHKRVLQLLQSGGVRGRWTLKAPNHAMQLETLTRVYPDARIILLHRDPVVLTLSVCSLLQTITGSFSDANHRPYIAEHWTNMLERCINAVNAFRDANPDANIVDVHYKDFIRDPIETMRNVYVAFGDSAEGGPLDAMRERLAARPQNKYGRHDYAPEDFGLDPNALDERFADYRERYGVAREYEEFPDAKTRAKERALIPKMKAWRVHAYGEPVDALQLDEVEIPEPGEGEVRIRNLAIPLNLNDLERIQGGNMMAPPPLPSSPGMEVMGIVDACGDGAEALMGARVVAITKQAYGGFAEFALCPAASTFIIPEAVPLPDAAAIFFPFHLAWLGLFDRGNLKAGESVLIHAAAGGSGSAAIQLAKNAGARVFATAGSEEKLALCRELGADVAINYTTDDFVETIINETNGVGVDVVFDNVGEAVMEKSVRAIAYNGRYLMMGFASNKAVADEKFLTPRTASLGNFHFSGVMLAYAADPMASMLKRGMGWNFPSNRLGAKIQEEIVDLVLTQKIRPVVGATAPFEETPRAFEALASRKTTGRTVVLLEGAETEGALPRGA